MTARKANVSDKPLKSESRRPGRPRGGAINAEQRERLLDITLQLFAHRGIAETSLNAIAREAGVSAAMMNYYFTSREALLDVVIEERFLPLRSGISSVFMIHANDPVQAITMLVKEIAEIAERDTWFAPLWVQEATAGMSVLRQRIYERYGKSQREQVHSIMERWQQEGRLNPDLHPSLLITSLLSLILIPLSIAEGSDMGFTRQMVTDHALTLLCQGIKPVK